MSVISYLKQLTRRCSESWKPSGTQHWPLKCSLDLWQAVPWKSMPQNLHTAVSSLKFFRGKSKSSSPCSEAHAVCLPNGIHRCCILTCSGASLPNSVYLAYYLCCSMLFLVDFEPCCDPQPVGWNEFCLWHSLGSGSLLDHHLLSIWEWVFLQTRSLENSKYA